MSSFIPPAPCRAWPCVIAIALPLLAQDLPDLREARRLTFAPNGAVEVEYIPNDAVSANDAAMLQMEIFQQQIGASVPYYGAVAMAPGMGLQSEATVAGANFHDADNARAFALAGCEELRRDGPDCVVVMVIRPQGWEPGRPCNSTRGDGGAARRVSPHGPPARHGNLRRDRAMGHRRERGSGRIRLWTRRLSRCCDRLTGDRGLIHVKVTNASICNLRVTGVRA